MANKVDLSDFEVAREYWMSFCKKYNIDASSLKNIRLTDKGKERMAWAAKEYGFDFLLMIPAGVLAENLSDNKKFLVFKGGDKENQDTNEKNPIQVSHDFDEWITLRPQVFYLKNKDQVDKYPDETMKKLARQEEAFLLVNLLKSVGCAYPRIVEMEKKLNLNGLDLVSAMILERHYFDECRHHLFSWENCNATWLTKTKDAVTAGTCLSFCWIEEYSLLSITLYNEFDRGSELGSVFVCDIEIK